jgi:hypothetical protein
MMIEVGAMRFRLAALVLYCSMLMFAVGMGSYFTMCRSWGDDLSSSQGLQLAVAAYALASGRKKRKWGGSVVGHKTYDRERVAAAIRLENDYFGPRALYNEEMFRRR